MFINSSKEDRARRVVANPNKFDADSVERKALEAGKNEKLDGEELVLFVYRLIGGAVAGDPKPVVSAPEYQAETVGKEVEEVGKPQKRVRKTETSEA